MSHGSDASLSTYGCHCHAYQHVTRARLHHQQIEAVTSSLALMASRSKHKQTHICTSDAALLRLLQGLLYGLLYGCALCRMRLWNGHSQQQPSAQLQLMAGPDHAGSPVE